MSPPTYYLSRTHCQGCPFAIKSGGWPAGVSAAKADYLCVNSRRLRRARVGVRELLAAR